MVSAAFVGAVLGDQAGYLIGRFGGAPLVERLARSPAAPAVLGRARALVDRRGGLGVFFSTWLVAPLGPWVNFIAGTTGLNWLRFTLWDVLGEAVWVTALCRARLWSLPARSRRWPGILGNAVGLLAALAVVARRCWSGSPAR